MIAKTRAQNYEYCKRVIDDLIHASEQVAPEFEVVSLMKLLVPEFISNNSPFEIIDQAVHNKVG